MSLSGGELPHELKSYHPDTEIAAHSPISFQLGDTTVPVSGLDDAISPDQEPPDKSIGCVAMRRQRSYQERLQIGVSSRLFCLF